MFLEEITRRLLLKGLDLYTLPPRLLLKIIGDDGDGNQTFTCPQCGENVEITGENTEIPDENHFETLSGNFDVVYVTCGHCGRKTRVALPEGGDPVPLDDEDEAAIASNQRRAFMKPATSMAANRCPECGNQVVMTSENAFGVVHFKKGYGLYNFVQFACPNPDCRPTREPVPDKLLMALVDNCGVPCVPVWGVDERWQKDFHEHYGHEPPEDAGDELKQWENTEWRCRKCEHHYEMTAGNTLVRLYVEEEGFDHFVTQCPKCPEHFQFRGFGPRAKIFSLLEYAKVDFVVEHNVPDEVKESRKRAAHKKAENGKAYSKKAKAHNRRKDSQRGEPGHILEKPAREVIKDFEHGVIGQPQAHVRVGRVLKLVQAGLRDDDLTLGSFLLLGPHGVGKSETPRMVALSIHDDEEALCAIPCEQLQTEHSLWSIAGSSVGHVGAGDKEGKKNKFGTVGDTLLKKTLIEGRPGYPGILVFEEFEKCHHTVQNYLLGGLQEGRFVLNNGIDVIDLTNTLVFFTSNAGSRELEKKRDNVPTGFSAPLDELKRDKVPGKERIDTALKAAKKVFSPELLDRMDEKIVYEWLAEDQFVVILDLKLLDQFAEKLGRSGHSVEFEHSAKLHIARQGLKLGKGGRALKGSVRRYLEGPMADKIIDWQEAEAKAKAETGAEPRNAFFRVSHANGDEELTILVQPIPAEPEPQQDAAKQPLAPIEPPEEAEGKADADEAAA